MGERELERKKKKKKKRRRAQERSISDARLWASLMPPVTELSRLSASPQVLGKSKIISTCG